MKNFPLFLAGLIFCTKSVEIQTFVSKILYQELGEGNFQKAHPVTYETTMSNAGLALNKIINTYLIGLTHAHTKRKIKTCIGRISISSKQAI